tara:strand:+ start:372 stop:1079 length:708 start_codon:yes stop_codon:yes gene_type:complete
MALPVLNTPTYELTVPSTGETLKYRPFLVKEQKVLMIAQEAGNEKQILGAIGDIIESCTFGELKNVQNLPTYDIEYIFVNLRARSVGETIDLEITCPDDEKTKVPVTIDLNELKVSKVENHTNVIQLTDTIGMTLRYPSIKNLGAYAGKTKDIAKMTFDVIADCIENIFDENEVYEEMTKQELHDFIDQMTTDQFEKVQEFFDTMPKLKHTIKVKNPNTEVESEVVLEGMQSFLG